MNIEENLFKKTSIVFERLIPYGFIKNNNHYIYRKKFLNNSFEAIIDISETKEVTGKIYDLSFGGEYLNHKIENQTGEFVSKVRESYEEILKDIIAKCCLKNYFCSKQANRLANHILEIYHDTPEFLWEKTPECAVFRNKNNAKWYGIIMNIPFSKIANQKGNVDILNVKLDPSEIKELLTKKGYYKSYHMNKKYWITITLDDTISDKEIISLIVKSHKYTETTNEWIIPANPKYYDITNYQENDIITWKQSSNIKIGDIIYIYLGSPYSCIIYKCLAKKVNIFSQYHDQFLNIQNSMELKILKKYSNQEFTFLKLNNHGLKAIRGPRHIPASLSKELNKE